MAKLSPPHAVDLWLAFPRNQEGCCHPSLTSQADDAPGLKLIMMLQCTLHLLRHLDASGKATSLKAASHVYRIAPDIVDELVHADHTSHHWTGVHTNPRSKPDL